ncbi:MAG: hypothetical protein WBM98_12305 [Maribacter sp.]|uniref:hypothetical protein n=1 Tax=Maribacter sp. TaxID=1897614 RepID=UPI003C724B7E
MSKNDLMDKVPLARVYKHKDYTIEVAANWYIDEIDGKQTFFYGPKVGEKRIGFYVTAVEKQGKSYKDAARKMKSEQEKNKEYKVLEQANISDAGFKALMRRSCWYEEDMDMMLFIREIFTESENKVFILSSSIPNSPDLEELDSAIIHVMNSFRFN